MSPLPAGPFGMEWPGRPRPIMNHDDPKTVSSAANDPLPMKDWDEVRKLLKESAKNTNDLFAVVSSVVQGLTNDKLRQLARSDWVRTFSIDTSNASATKYLAGILTGGRPFTGFTVLSVGGAGSTGKISVNGDEAFTVAVGDKVTNEIIWSLEWTTGTPASGTAKLRVNAYAGP